MSPVPNALRRADELLLLRISRVDSAGVASRERRNRMVESPAFPPVGVLAREVEHGELVATNPLGLAHAVGGDREANALAQRRP
jgi:hypothetical protein